MACFIVLGFSIKFLLVERSLNKMQINKWTKEVSISPICLGINKSLLDLRNSQIDFLFLNI